MENHQRRERILFFFLIIVILLLRLWHISELNAPWIFEDEIMYWSHAANMAGLNWTEVGTLWYSYGYSLLLVPLFWITHNTAVLYRMAIVLNALMGAASFVLGYAIIREADKKIGRITAMLVSFAAACYSAYIFQSNIAWSETFIYTWFLLILWSTIRFCKHTSLRNTIFLTAEIFFLYLIHNRNIIIFIAYIMTLLWMMFKKQIDWKKVGAAVAVLAVGFAINSLVKQQLSIMMWGDTNLFKGNNLSTQGQSLKLFLSLEGWWKLIRSFAGKMWYVLTASLLLAYPGIIYLGRKMYDGIRRRKDGDQASDTDNMSSFYLFLSLFVCGTIAVSTIVMADLDMDFELRVDRYFYGRYSETVLGILIMFGLLHIVSILKKRESIRECLAGMIFYLLCSGSLYLEISPYPFVNNDTLAVNCVPGIFYFEKFSLVNCCAIVLLFYLAVYLLFCFSSTAREKIQAGKRAGLSILTAVIFCTVGENVYQVCIPSYQNTNKQVCTKITDIMKENLGYTTYQFLDLDWSAKQIIRSRVVDGRIKYLLPDNSVDDVSDKGGFLAGINHAVTHGLPDDMEENCFFIMEKRSGGKIDLSDKDLYFILADGSMVLMGIGEELEETMRAEGYPCSRIENANIKEPDEADLQILIEDKEKQVVKLGQELSFDAVLQDDSESIVWNDRYTLAYHIHGRDGEPVLWGGNQFQVETFAGDQTIPMAVSTSNLNEIGEHIVEPALFDTQSGKWLSGIKADTVRMTVNGSWQFEDNQFLDNGVDENGIRKLNPGGVSYGPYWKAQAGDYVITIDGENLDQAELSVTSGFGEKNHAYKMITEESGQVSLSVSLEENVENLEILVQNHTEDEIKLYGIEMECKGKEKAEPDQVDLDIGIIDEDKTKAIRLEQELRFDVILRDGGEAVKSGQYLLSYHLYNGKGEPVLWEGEQIPIESFQGKQVLPIEVNAEQLDKIGEYIVEPALVDAETGKWLSNVKGRSESIHVSVDGLWKFEDNQFLDQGEDENGIRRLDSGGVSYGPYWKVQSGDYLLTINGENLDQAEVCLTSQYGEKEHNFTVMKEKSGRIVLSVSLEEEVENLEVLIQNPTEEKVRLYCTKMKKR